MHSAALHYTLNPVTYNMINRSKYDTKFCTKDACETKKILSSEKTFALCYYFFFERSAE